MEEQDIEIRSYPAEDLTPAQPASAEEPSQPEYPEPPFEIPRD